MNGPATRFRRGENFCRRQGRNADFRHGRRTIQLTRGEGFFSVVHDPTQLNRQGADVGTQYRSAIFYTTEEQKEAAQADVAQLDAAHIFPAKIVTDITPLIEFFPGEDYHQDYALKNPDNPYIQVCDLPKIASLKQQFPDLFQEYTL